MNGVTLVPVEHDPFSGAALAAFLPVTDAQREVWLASIMDAESNLAYNEGNRLRLRGVLDVSKLHAALQQIVDRHEPLRGTFSPDGRWMCVLERLPIDLPEFDISADPDTGLAEHEAVEMSTPFDLENGPLLRLRLLRAGPDLHYLMLNAHHIVCDGWSVAVMFTELGALYSAAVEGRALTLPAAPRYGDYTVIEHNFTASEDGREHAEYWRTLLKDPPPALDLPGDRPRQAQRTYAASRVDYPLDAALVSRLRKTGAEFGASLVATTLAAFASLLNRLTGAEDMVIGLAAAGQSFHGQKMLVGHCVNLLPLRLRLKSDNPFTDCLKATRAAVLDAFDHQGSTFGSLLPTLNIQRDETRPPLVSIIFNIDVRDDDIRHAGLEVDYATMVRRADTFEFYVNMVDNGRDLILECTYNTGLFSAEVVQARLREYEALLNAICEDPQQPIRSLPLLSSADRARLLAPAQKPAPARLLHEWFTSVVATRPDAIAVRAEDEELTYAQLESRANQLAHALVKRGIGPDVLVGLYLERSLDTLIAILGVLKAGGAYLPIDTEYPPERLAFMLEDSRASLVLTHSERQARLPAGSTSICLDTDWAVAIGAEAETVPETRATPDNLAYVIYTSGSTGKPKGCLTTHANVSRLFTSTEAWFGFGADDVWTLFHSYAFDFSVWEIWGALLYGGRLIVVPYWAAREPERFLTLLAVEGVTVLNQTPSAFRQLVQADGGMADAPALALRYVVFGGEALELQSLRPWFERRGDGRPGKGGAQLVNMYGITETTVHVTYRPINLDDLQGNVTASLIGAPIPDLSLYVLDSQRQPVPAGVAGEMWVGGAGVARGYLNRPELTAERFVDDPFNPGQRLYKTGDLARHLPNGDLEYLGRIDHQVKLRGFRVELGEIEAALNRLPGILASSVGVVERTPGDQRLVAWLVWKDPATATMASELRSGLRETLPFYMIPQHFVDLPKLPLTGNGKLDRKALPPPFEAVAAASKTPPRSPAERAVAEVWGELLGIREPLAAIGIEDRFFDLGGHSLLAVQAAGKLQKRFGKRPLLRVVMMDPLAQVARAYVPEEAAAPEAKSPPALQVPAAVDRDIGAEPVAAEAVPEAGGSLIGKLGRWLGKRT